MKDRQIFMHTMTNATFLCSSNFLYRHINEPLLSCKIQSSRYRKALVSHSQTLEISEGPEQLHSRYKMRDMFVTVVTLWEKQRLEYLLHLLSHQINL